MPPKSPNPTKKATGQRQRTTKPVITLVFLSSAIKVKMMPVRIATINSTISKVNKKYMRYLLASVVTIISYFTIIYSVDRYRLLG